MVNLPPLHPLPVSKVLHTIRTGRDNCSRQVYFCGGHCPRDCLQDSCSRTRYHKLFQRCAAPNRISDRPYSISSGFALIGRGIHLAQSCRLCSACVQVSDPEAARTPQHVLRAENRPSKSAFREFASFPVAGARARTAR